MTDEARFSGTDIALRTSDIFTEGPFAGNQLAVFPRVKGLDVPMMLTIATVTNLGEAVFIASAKSDTQLLGASSEKSNRIFHVSMRFAISMERYHTIGEERVS